MQRDKKRGSARKKKIRPRPGLAGTHPPPVAPIDFRFPISFSDGDVLVVILNDGRMVSVRRSCPR